MTFPNAANGVKKLFTAEILTIVAIVSVIVTAILAVTTYAAGTVATQSESLGAAGIALGSLIGMFVTGGAFVVLAIVATILNLVGLIKATKDDDAFKIALFSTVVSFCLIIVGGIFSMNKMAMAYSMTESLGSIASLFVTIYTIQGIRNLAVKLEDYDMDHKGNNILKVMLVVIVLTFIGKLTSAIFFGIGGQIVGGWILIAAYVLSIIQYLLFLSFLSKAKRMLADK